MSTAILIDITIYLILHQIHLLVTTARPLPFRNGYGLNEVAFNRMGNAPYINWNAKAKEVLMQRRERFKPFWWPETKKYTTHESGLVNTTYGKRITSRIPFSTTFRYRWYYSVTERHVSTPKRIHGYTYIAPYIKTTDHRARGYLLKSFNEKMKHLF